MTSGSCPDSLDILYTVAGAVALCPPPWRLLGDPCQGRRPPVAGRLLWAVVPSCGLCCCPLSVVLPVGLRCSCRPPGHAVPVRCRGPSCGPLWASWRRRSSMLPVSPGGSWARAGAVPGPPVLLLSLCGVYMVGIRRSAIRRVHVPCVASDLLDFQRPAGDIAGPAPPGVSSPISRNKKKGEINLNT